MRIARPLFCFVALFAMPAAAEEAPRPIPAPVADEAPHAGDAETAVLAGGCYWGMQAIFERVRGVKAVTAGFSGMPDPAHSLVWKSADSPSSSDSTRSEIPRARASLGRAQGCGRVSPRSQRMTVERSTPTASASRS